MVCAKFEEVCRRRLFFVACLVGFVSSPVLADDIQDRIDRIQQEQCQKFKLQLDEFPAFDENARDSVAKYSERGDLKMFAGDFAGAEADYQAMVRLDPAVDRSHWRLGIANFFADHAEAGAAQFEKYHGFDNVDRENGIWRYFCHVRLKGKKAAASELLRYEKDDRPPFREVYQLFDGKMTSAQVLEAADGGREVDRESRRFYSHLYVGLNASLDGDTNLAVSTLQKAVLNEWPQTAGYGPRWMWHVGRLELARITKPASSK